MEGLLCQCVGIDISNIAPIWSAWLVGLDWNAGASMFVAFAFWILCTLQLASLALP